MRTSESSPREGRVSMRSLRHAFAQAPVAMTLATGLGFGLSPIAPGTAGSALGVALAAVLARLLAPSHGTSLAPALGLLMSGLVVAAAGVPLATQACRVLGAKDPGCVVIDEVAGQFLASSVVPLFVYGSRSAAVFVWAVSFFAFRFFDIVKPGLVGRSQSLPEGLGVVVDDVLAGLLAAGATAVAGWVASGGRPWA